MNPDTKRCQRILEIVGEDKILKLIEEFGYETIPLYALDKLIKQKEIKKAIKVGKPFPEIALELNVGVATVYRLAKLKTIPV